MWELLLCRLPVQRTCVFVALACFLSTTRITGRCESSISQRKGAASVEQNVFISKATAKEANAAERQLGGWKQCKYRSFSKHVPDEGFKDAYQGWYDVQRCGKCYDYCRWVGNSGSGGNPTTSTWHAPDSDEEASFWSCRLAGESEEYTPKDAKGPEATEIWGEPPAPWTFPKCAKKGADEPKFALPDDKVHYTQDDYYEKGPVSKGGGSFFTSGGGLIFMLCVCGGLGGLIYFVKGLLEEDDDEAREFSEQKGKGKGKGSPFMATEDSIQLQDKGKGFGKFAPGTYY